MELGQKFADFVTGLRFEQVDPRDLETAKQSILDFLGVALAGVGELPEQILWSRVSRCSSYFFSGPGSGVRTRTGRTPTALLQVRTYCSGP